MATIRQSVLIEAYHRLMSVWDLPYSIEIPAKMRYNCMLAAVDLKVAIGPIPVNVEVDNPPTP